MEADSFCKRKSSERKDMMLCESYMVIAAYPPSTTISAPVINDPALSEANKSVTPISSSEFPKRFIGV